MFKRTVHLSVACSPAQAFHHIAVEFFTNHPRWDPDIVELTKTSPGPVGVGTTGREVREVGGRRFVSTFRVTGFEPDHGFAHRGVEGGAVENVDYAISPRSGGSTVALTVEIVARALPVRLLAPLIRRQIERNFNANVARFEQALNAASGTS